MKLSEAIGLLLTSLRAESRSEATLVWYRRRLTCLSSYLGDPDLESITQEDLRRFLADLRSRDVRYVNQKRKQLSGGLSLFTVQGYLRSIKRFYGWLVECDYLAPEKNVAARLRRQSLPRLIPKEISERDIRALVMGARQSKYPERDLAIIVFLADTGVRAAGLVGLRLENLDLENERAVVTEKGAKSRYVFLSKFAIGALNTWLLVREPRSEFVFTSSRGGRLTTSGLYQILERTAKAVGVHGPFGPHSFRHRFAKRYLLDGGDLASLSRLMGHSDIAVTGTYYTVFSMDELKRKHDKHSRALSCLTS